MAGVFHLMNPSLRQTPWVTALTSFGRDLSQWALVTRQHPHHTETLLDWALKVKISRLVIWGGDGTLHRVVKGLWKRRALDKMELALVPAGTCNDLARYYGLSKESWGRWEAVAPHGRLARLTLAHLAWKSSSQSLSIEGEDVFINNAGFGRPRSSFEKKEPPWRVLFSMNPIGVSARWEAGKLDGRYYFALAALAPRVTRRPFRSSTAGLLTDTPPAGCAPNEPLSSLAISNRRFAPAASPAASALRAAAIISS